MASLPDMIASLGDLASRVPSFVYEQDRLLLMGLTAVATAVGVGTVTRNHELGLLGKVSVAVALFCLVLGLGLVATYALPILADMGQQARSGGNR